MLVGPELVEGPDGLSERSVTFASDVDQRAGHSLELEFGLLHQSRQPEATDRGPEELGRGGRGTGDLALRPQEPEASYMEPDRPRGVVVLAVHVVGDHPPDRDRRRPGTAGHDPARRERSPMDLREGDAGLEDDPSAPGVEGEDAIEALRLDQCASRVGGGVAVGPSGPARKHGRRAWAQGVGETSRVGPHTLRLRLDGEPRPAGGRGGPGHGFMLRGRVDARCPRAAAPRGRRSRSGTGGSTAPSARSAA